MALTDSVFVYPDLDTSSVEYAPDFSTAGVRSWLRTGKMRDVLDFWNDIRQFRRCPELCDVDLTSVPELSNWMILLERPVPGGDCLFRTVGRKIIELSHLDITGQPLMALPDPEYRRMFQANCDAVTRAAMPLASRYRRMLKGQSFDFERLDLPLTLESGRVGGVLVGMHAAGVD
ncbi:PAS domain-containing protein [Thalassobaculum sp.]|uniref:PAS domain-containing protein n=1 Tax=Thalassobaculum sp. TaxID=2022740 RepID=UPI003B593BB7